ncbi:hypothetical protein ILUMI_22385 [Ignelater luminosus]|uniref:Uncharacterized protein n=1 Tax=Ignelater luminosus TaxID=2038154 RepID=A0A8K0G2V8_IGNLU|nr:hypothetical protein ILUMI_22385 [Ignelater luminosus]
MHRIQLREELTVYEMPFRVAFLLQHERSGLFLAVDYKSWAATIYGLESPVKLQPLEMFGDGIVGGNYYFKAYVP